MPEVGVASIGATGVRSMAAAALGAAQPCWHAASQSPCQAPRSRGGLYDNTKGADQTVGWMAWRRRGIAVGLIRRVANGTRIRDLRE